MIDDREDNRLALRELFERLEYQVIEAAGGAAGVALAQSHHPDCILLDLEMPGVNGFEVLERLKQEDLTAEVPIIILTGAEDSVRNLERALRGGAVDYLTKPISPVRVAVRVRSAIERRSLIRDRRALQSSLTVLVGDVSRSVLAIKASLMSLAVASGASLAAPASQCLQEVGAACDALLPRLQHAMEDSSISLGDPGSELRVIDVGALAAAVVQRLRPLAERNGIGLSVSVRTAEAGVSPACGGIADRSFEHVLWSLLASAVAGAPAGAEIRVELACGDDRVEIAVTYPGGPSAPAELAVCRRLIEAQRGQLVTRTDPSGCVRTVITLSSTAEPWR